MGMKELLSEVERTWLRERNQMMAEPPGARVIDEVKEAVFSLIMMDLPDARRRLVLCAALMVGLVDVLDNAVDAEGAPKPQDDPPNTPNLAQRYGGAPPPNGGRRG